MLQTIVSTLNQPDMFFPKPISARQMIPAAVIRLSLIFVVLCFMSACTGDDDEEDCFTTTNYSGSIVEVINQYRIDNGLPAIPESPALTYVAEYHVYDLAMNKPMVGDCNLHSWSDQGIWSPCCYTDELPQIYCMRQKPKELTDYPGEGYEIAAKYTTISINPNCALESWRSSPRHHAVILNQGVWEHFTWRAIGGTISKYHAVVWFGEEIDPLSESVAETDTDI